MKTLILLCTFLSIVVFSETSLMGQQKTDKIPIQNTPERRAEGQTKWMAKQFSINEQSISAVYLVNLRFELISDSIRMSNSLPEKKREAFQKFAIKKNEALSKVLTPNQYNSYKKYKDGVKMKAAQFRKNNNN